MDSLILGSLVLAAAPASAQDGPSDPAPPPTIEEIERGEAEEPEPEPDAEPESQTEPDSESRPAPAKTDPPSTEADPAGWELLERAVEHLARGESTKAHRLLEQLADEYADHPAAAMSADALAVLRDKQPDQVAPDAAESTTTAARAELAFFQTVHGLALGGELCVIAECEDPKAIVALLGVGAGLGLGASLGLTSDGITPGHALLLNSGTAWGFANGLMLSIALDTEFETGASVTALGQLAGLGASAILWPELQPTSGQVSMANSGGFWAGWLAFWAHGVNEFEADGQTMATTMLVAADIGILSGALLSREYPMSRGRTFVIDSGGILGLLTGMGIYVFADADMNTSTGFSLATMAGTVAGLGTATYLTRNWDAPDDPEFSANWTIVPTDGGAQLSVGGSF